MATDNPGIVIRIDLVKDMLDFSKYHFVLGTEIGTLVQFLDFLVQQLAPFLLIVQIYDLIDNMVFVQGQAQDHQ